MRITLLVDSETWVVVSEVVVVKPGLLVEDVGQVETDEVYVDRQAHYIFPVQAKGGGDRHYLLVEPNQISKEDLENYRKFTSRVGAL